MRYDDFDDVRDIYGTQEDYIRERDFVQQVEQSFPAGYINHYIKCFQFEDIGYVIDEFAETFFEKDIDDFDLFGLGEVTEFDMKMPTMTMSSFKQAALVNMIEMYMVGAPKSIIPVLDKVLQQAKERLKMLSVDAKKKLSKGMEKIPDVTIGELQLGDIGWWDKIVGAVGGAVGAVASAATWAGKQVVGAVAGALKWVGNQFNKFIKGLTGAEKKEKKCRAVMNKWNKSIVSNSKRAKTKGHFQKLAKNKRKYDKAKRDLAKKGVKLRKYQKAKSKSKQKAPLYAISSIKKGKKYLKKKGRRGSIKGLYGLNDYYMGDIGLGEVFPSINSKINYTMGSNDGIGFIFVGTTGTVLLIAGAIALAAALGALFSSMSNGNKESTKLTEEINMYEKQQSAKMMEVTVDYDPATDPVQEQVIVTHPVTGEPVKALRYKNKIILPTIDTIEKQKKTQRTMERKRAEGKAALNPLAQMGMLQWVVIGGLSLGGLYLVGNLMIASRRSKQP